jgi:ubiquinone/menaquinone biosynthesis C-methylase UbiE
VAHISLEHWHRYLFAREFVKNKVALDVACGEGYGSHIMAQVAQRVVAVDVNAELIQHARSKYMTDAAGRLEFHAGSAAKIPVKDDNIFDVAVSFETIEHLNDRNQSSFLSEIKRLLKRDGLFIISTPDKLHYSDVPQHRNHFHTKEFYADEFDRFLGQYFAHVSIINQRVYTASYMWPQAKPNGTFCEYRLRDDGKKFAPTEDPLERLFMVALCSDTQLPEHRPSILLDVSHRVFADKDELIDRLARKQVELDSMLNSKSWQITAPLRWLRRRLERLFPLMRTSY